MASMTPQEFPRPDRESPRSGGESGGEEDWPLPELEDDEGGNEDGSPARRDGARADAGEEARAGAGEGARPGAGSGGDAADLTHRPDTVPRREGTSYLALPPDLRRQWTRGRRWYEGLIVRALLAMGLGALAGVWWFLLRGGS